MTLLEQKVAGVSWVVLSMLLGPTPLRAQQAEVGEGLLAHWPLATDGKDTSGNGRHVLNRGVAFKAGPDGKAAWFDGRGAHLELPAAHKLNLGAGDFSIAAFVHIDRTLADVAGDVVSLYEPMRRRGFHLTIKTNAVTTTQANARHLQFGIDSGKESAWIDCGRPGKAILAFALTAHEGQLYVGTCEPGKTESGRVYRYAGGDKWVDCGAPAHCNAVTALAVHEGKLYAGVGKYRLAGSALPESENVNLGGRVLRYDGDSKWSDCGQLPDTEAIGGLVVFRGKLHASSLYKPAGFYRYEDGAKWTDCGTPGGKRVEAMAVYQGNLYASSYDGGRVYRYDGTTWTDCGQLGNSSQTYSFVVHRGRLLVGTWPSGRVYRFDKIEQWTDVGQLGEEKEVMGMLVHNGRLLAGTLPSAEVYQYEADNRWKKLACLDATPAVKYRRAWTAAEYQGRVYFSTLPLGRIFAFEVGKSTTWEHEVPNGWHHVVAVKRAGRLELYLNGKRVVESAAFDAADYDLNTAGPLLIGAGATEYFQGGMREVRLYGRGLTEAEVRELAGR